MRRPGEAAARELPGSAPAAPRGVLFDLDGTLADTAPDLARALNRVRAARGEAPLPLARVRPVVSLGGRALVRLAFGVGPGEDGFEPLHRRFLEAYREHVAVRTRLFPGMEAVLAAIEARGLPWGIVTNKASWLTVPLLEALGLAARAACVVCGDTTPNRKPHPEPLLYACARLGREPAHCLYVGDSRNDVAAAREAGVRALIALFGYIPEDEDPAAWGAHAALDSPAALLAWLERACGADAGRAG